MFLKSKNTIFWNNFLNTHDIKIQDYLIPLKKNIPIWYKKSKDKPGVMNIKGCPSFSDLFTNSLIYIAPCDFDIEVGRHGCGINIPVTSRPLLKLDGHPLSGPNNQASEFWDEDLVNVKLRPPLILKSNYKIKMMIVPPFYHNPRSNLITSIGCIDFLPTQTVELNLNCFVDLKGRSRTETKILSFKYGDPLAYLYFPEGVPEFEEKDFKIIPHKYSKADYLKAILNFNNKNNDERKCRWSQKNR